MNGDHVCDNYIGGAYVPPSSGKYLDVHSPVTLEVISRVALGRGEDVDTAVAKANEAFPAWREMTVKSRAQIMFRFHQLLETHADELADIIVRENGKNKSEALAEVAKGNETVEWACSMAQLIQGKILQVSRGVTCSDHREPLGVVTCIVPFNFPLMVPMWTIPIALTAGNCVILKPSEKVPMTMHRVSQLLTEAGLPPGVFQIVNGTVDAVNALIDNPGTSAVTFVGSSKVAEIVAKRARAINKKVLALGGAKNHLVVLPDCDSEGAATDIVASYAGCCGQRCMAASALVLVGDSQHVFEKVVQKSAALKAGTAPGQVGPVIDGASQQRILKYITEAEEGGAEILLDGRKWTDHQPGKWVGPTVILHKNKDDPALKEEIFGPVLSCIKVDTWDEALAIENSNPHGNAACIYTTVGAHAEYFQYRFRAAMIGVCVGIPVPREPFAFGGLYGTLSKYGDLDITGDGALEFFTNRRKITTRWPAPSSSAMAPVSSAPQHVDRANFNGVL